MNRPTPGCPHRPHTRYLRESNTTFCMRCAPPPTQQKPQDNSSSPVRPTTNNNNFDPSPSNTKSVSFAAISASSSSSPSALSSSSSSVSISDFLRTAEHKFRQVEQSRRLALCCLSEEMTVSDLELLRAKAKADVDGTLMAVLRRLEALQQRLYRDVDDAVDGRIAVYDRVRALVGECDKIAAECGEALSWKNSFDASASIAAANHLDDMMERILKKKERAGLSSTPSASSTSAPEANNEDDHRGTKFSSSSTIAIQNKSINPPHHHHHPLADEMSSLLLRLHRTMRLEVESVSKRFGLDESDLRIRTLEQELEIPFVDFAHATNKQMEHYFPRRSNDEIEEAILLSSVDPFPTSKYRFSQTDSSSNNNNSYLLMKEDDLEKQSERVKTEKMFGSKNLYGAASLPQGYSRSELLGRAQRKL